MADDKNGLTQAVVIKNGKSVTFVIGKLWIFISSMLGIVGVIITVITYFINLEGFRAETKTNNLNAKAERDSMKVETKYNQQMIIEINWNLQNYIAKDPRHVGFKWENYPVIKEKLKIK